MTAKFKKYTVNELVENREALESKADFYYDAMQKCIAEKMSNFSMYIVNFGKMLVT